jgi:hypothetical protein
MGVSKLIKLIKKKNIIKFSIFKNSKVIHFTQNKKITDVK